MNEKKPKAAPRQPRLPLAKPIENPSCGCSGQDIEVETQGGGTKTVKGGAYFRGATHTKHGDPIH
jgi:hypothetical protein